jgi:hypothetical protein
MPPADAFSPPCQRKSRIDHFALEEGAAKMPINLS